MTRVTNSKEHHKCINKEQHKRPNKESENRTTKMTRTTQQPNPTSYTASAAAAIPVIDKSATCEHPKMSLSEKREWKRRKRKKTALTKEIQLR